MSIPACHAGDQGSIPCRGDCFYRMNEFCLRLSDTDVCSIACLVVYKSGIKQTSIEARQRKPENAISKALPLKYGSHVCCNKPSPT